MYAHSAKEIFILVKVVLLRLYMYVCVGDVECKAKREQRKMKAKRHFVYIFHEIYKGLSTLNDKIRHISPTCIPTYSYKVYAYVYINQYTYICLCIVCDVHTYIICILFECCVYLFYSFLISKNKIP